MTILLFSLLQFFIITSEAPSTEGVEWPQGTAYDFGEMEQGVAETVQFEFRNTGTDSLLIETVRTTCGCTAAEWDKTPIAPGAIGTLRIEYDAFQTGTFRKKVRVYFFDRKKAEVLWVYGEVL